MTFDAPLPGFAPDLTRLDLHRRADGGWTLRVASCDGVGFITAADYESYELDTAGELLDVVGAVLDALCWA